MSGPHEGEGMNIADLESLLQDSGAGVVHLVARNGDGSVKRIYLAASDETAADILGALEELDRKWEDPVEPLHPEEARGSLMPADSKKRA